jgi:1-acyl-sn-glycerol-3-phosphate acyltransferase
VRTTNVSTVAPVFPDDGPRGKRLSRRLRAIPLEILAFVLVTVLLPVLLVAAALVDLVLWLFRRKPWVGIRLTAFLWWFLFGEMQALAGLLWIWLRSGGRDTERRRIGLYNLRVHWIRHHLGGITRLFNLRFEVEGLDRAGPGPMILMLRHASIIDNTLGDALVAHAHGMGLRYVIKRELQAIPTIDIGGRWVPTNYLRRTADDPDAELAKLTQLAVDLGEGEGILIYPEGTRHTDAKLARIKEKLRESGSDVTDRAERLQHLLPPRLGGPIALLDAAAGADVVFCAHVGFDGYERISDIWAGTLVGQTISVSFWRCPAAEIPADREGRVAWLYDNWQRMDDWVGEHRGNAPVT